MRILHAPDNPAGIATALSRAQRELGHTSDVLVFVQPYFKYEVDFNLELDKKGFLRRWLMRVETLWWCMKYYDVFHFHFRGTFLPMNLDLPILKLFGKKVVMSCYGSDVRQADVALEKQLTDFTQDEIYAIYRKKDDAIKRRHLKFISLFADVLTIPYSQLQPYMPPCAQIVEVAVDLKQLHYEGQCNCRPDVLKIVHAPTDRIAKGTKYIVETIEQLQEHYPGRIEFVLLENMMQGEVFSECKTADLVIDQLLFESYGVFAIEMMAMGKPVIGHIKNVTMNDPPIALATKGNLYHVVEYLLSNPDMCAFRAEQCRRYVEEHFDSAKIAQKFIALYSGEKA